MVARKARLEDAAALYGLVCLYSRAAPPREVFDAYYALALEDGARRLLIAWEGDEDVYKRQHLDAVRGEEGLNSGPVRIAGQAFALCDGVSGIACRPAAGLRQRPAPHKVCRHGGKVAVACAAAVYRCDRHGRSEKEMLPVQAVTALCAQREKHARGLVARTQRLAHAARIEGVAHLRSRQAKKKLGLHLVYKKIVHIVQWGGQAALDVYKRQVLQGGEGVAVRQKPCLRIFQENRRCV